MSKICESPESKQLNLEGPLEEEYLTRAGRMSLMRFHLSDLQILHQRSTVRNPACPASTLCEGWWHRTPWTSLEGFGLIGDADPSQGLRRKKQVWGPEALGLSPGTGLSRILFLAGFRSVLAQPCPWTEGAQKSPPHPSVSNDAQSPQHGPCVGL